MPKSSDKTCSSKNKILLITNCIPKKNTLFIQNFLLTKLVPFKNLRLLFAHLGVLQIAIFVFVLQEVFRNTIGKNGFYNKNTVPKQDSLQKRILGYKNNSLQKRILHCKNGFYVPKKDSLQNRILRSKKGCQCL